MEKTSFESSLPLCFHKMSISFPITQLFPFTCNVTAHDRCFLCINKEAFFLRIISVLLSHHD
jgi:hypothetical protein